MMFFNICIWEKYHFQEFDFKVNHLTLKVTLNHKHNIITGFISQNPMQMRYYTIS